MVLSNTCSSIEQDPLAFADVFTELPGRAPYLPDSDAVTVTDQVRVVDDPATSPYPIWRPEAQYPEGYKIVRRGMVYEAKWYNQGQDPAMTVANPWETPWSLVGPVRPEDEPFVPETVAPGTYPDWDPTLLYNKGDRVVLDGLPYVARWASKGEVPPSLFPVAPDAAWAPLFTVPGEPASP
jgi:chitinase